MNKLSIIALALVAATGSAFADSADYDLQNRTAFTGNLTRAEVRAEFDRASAAGELPTVAEAYANVDSKTEGPSRDRAEVRAEAVQAAHTFRIQELW
ncbi:DUF4148 domain-containing protein [Variovorax sp. VNK109]|jgi:hypothetical protein|uniref:DUF4148 domain-containing protein n=1 Tax=Variovorax sp. VNK109 TaxID=3400919 RepID=UPI003C07D47B